MFCIRRLPHCLQESAIFLVTELCDGGDFSELNHGIDDPQAQGASSHVGQRTAEHRLLGSEAVDPGRGEGAYEFLWPFAVDLSPRARDAFSETQALAYCHDHGVAHRFPAVPEFWTSPALQTSERLLIRGDLKFENCLIKESVRDYRVGKAWQGLRCAWMSKHHDNVTTSSVSIQSPNYSIGSAAISLLDMLEPEH